MVITSYRFLNNPPPLQLLPFHRIHLHPNLPISSPYPINVVDLSALEKPTLPIHPPKPYPKIRRKHDTQPIHTTYVTVNDMTSLNVSFLHKPRSINSFIHFPNPLYPWPLFFRTIRILFGQELPRYYLSLPVQWIALFSEGKNVFDSRIPIRFPLLSPCYLQHPLNTRHSQQEFHSTSSVVPRYSSEQTPEANLFNELPVAPACAPPSEQRYTYRSSPYPSLIYELHARSNLFRTWSSVSTVPHRTNHIFINVVHKRNYAFSTSLAFEFIRQELSKH